MPGGPDGAQVDAAGYVWVALSGASKVARISPHGDLDMFVELPVKSPTSVTIGGPDLDTLFITTRGPDGGGLFAAKLPANIRGLPEPEVQDAAFAQGHRFAREERGPRTSDALRLGGQLIESEQDVRVALLESRLVDNDMKTFLQSTQGQRINLSPGYAARSMLNLWMSCSLSGCCSQGCQCNLGHNASWKRYNSATGRFRSAYDGYP
eukprot:scaffold401_cov399-Prasinococcus_capsulatus_cf.AAC.11